MQLWCSASDTAWSWTWQPYPGVWAFVVLVGFAGVVLNRYTARRHGVEPPPLHPLYVVGLLVLWLALDWPIGALGAGYLASVHMLQFLLIALVAPPLLLHGIVDVPLARGEVPPENPSLFQRLIAPPTSLILFNVAVLLTHLPPIVDSLMVTQAGSFLIDVLWLGTGLLFWWPLVRSRPVRARFPPPVRILYIIVGLMFSPIMFGIAGFLAYSQTPLFGIYELAPPMSALSSRDDHQAAGALMSIGGAIIAFIGISVIFFRWSKTDG